MTLDKYIVAKREDCRFAKVEHEVVDYEVRITDQNLIPDAVVIRLQDRFAEHGLRAYAGAVMTAADLYEDMKKHARNEHEWELMDAEQKSLHQLADYFNDQADRARKHHLKKIPD